MSEPRFPYGYKADASGVLGMGTMLTKAECLRMTTVNKCNPEFVRRTHAMMDFAYEQKVPLGWGTGWRIQPNPPPSGFAPPGKSNHEGFPADGVSGGAVAADMVPEPSWDWMEAHCADFGLRTFRDVNDEPWHTQPRDIPASRVINGVPRSEPWNLPVWPLDEEEFMAISDDDARKIARFVWAQQIDTSAAEGIEPQMARRLLHRTFLIVQQYMGGWNGKTPPDETMLERIDRNTKS